jgi:hypothetical protein
MGGIGCSRPRNCGRRRGPATRAEVHRQKHHREEEGDGEKRVQEEEGVTRKPMAMSVRAGGDEQRRHRFRHAAARDGEKGWRRRLEAPSNDSFGDDDEGGEAHLLVLSTARWRTCSGGAMVDPTVASMGFLLGFLAWRRGKRGSRWGG